VKNLMKYSTILLISFLASPQASAAKVVKFDLDVMIFGEQKQCDSAAVTSQLVRIASRCETVLNQSALACSENPSQCASFSRSCSETLKLTLTALSTVSNQISHRKSCHNQVQTSITGCERALSLCQAGNLSSELPKTF